ncbi:allantoin permease [Enterococcus sp. JM4C]|uniref:allantoin permease n=1 Tax=Candidatus Enterococcus huntleyi TaxID=1857217 RepID=UPI00137997B7|nr:putative allantoin permease [Enterococcus sp. JM4C]KAF1299239.1 allantoin permease [Enterococcus sp. JM4C]
MENKDYVVSEEEVARFKERGYNDDMLPKTSEKRNMGMKNYFTLWMGSVHNIPNYTAVGGFLFLGLSPINVMMALIISALVVALFMTMNGRAGSKYGIPFALHLRSTYGDVGAKLPGFLRGCVAAIAWFGLQNYTGSLALLVLIGKIWPGFLTIGGSASFFGIGIPGLISFTIFWAINMLIGLGGGNILNKFTAILSPLIYIVFGGMAIWAVQVAGGIGEILSFDTSGATQNINPIFAYFMIINSVLAVWAAPGASVSDFTQNAKSTRDQTVGQTASLLVAYVIFAFSSVAILIGGSIHYGIQEWNVLNIVERWDNFPAVIVAMTVFLLTTISTNATGNIIPAAYQLSALFPKKVNYKRGVIIASLISFIIMPWKLMENADSIFIFLNSIGAVLGPVAGVMIAHYFFIKSQKINLDALYMNPKEDNTQNSYRGLNRQAYIATIIALLISLSGQFIPALQVISNISWLVGFSCAFVIYYALKKLGSEDKTEEAFD